MVNSLDRPFRIDFCVSHPTNRMLSISLFSPFISVNHHGAREVWICPRILIVKLQMLERCCSDKEGADVMRHINTKDGIFLWITAELHHIC